MKQEFLDYLACIGLKDLIIARVATILEFNVKICPDEIMDIFISEYMKEDGTREYESLWFFSKRYTMEAKHFLAVDDFDIMPVNKCVHYFQLKKQDYEIESANDKSRLTILFTGGYQISGTLKGTKENCDHLWRIFKNYILANLEG
jgi:hypothetical protein